MDDGAPGGREAAALADETAWRRLYEAAGPVARQAVAEAVRANAPALARAFYDSLLADAQAGRWLSHELVSTHLNGSLQAWLMAMFAAPEASDVAALIRLQQKVGEVHARLMIPIPLVSRGARILKDALTALLRDSPLGREDLSWAQQYLGGMFDLALEVMSTAYLRDAQRGVRADEAYRLFSLGQNVAAERERQRAALMEWAQAVLLQTHEPQGAHALPAIRNAEFGVWLHHKGGAMFEGMPELPAVLQATARLDRELLPAMAAAIARGRAADVAAQVRTLQQQVGEIKYLLNALFDRIAAVDVGRDPLTQLLNRRFLPTVLAREVALAGSGGGTFSLLLVDVDHFKDINDRHGHGGGDAVLRQLAELLQDACRSGDYVFRYGGEEFLVVLVDAGAATLPGIAEALRARVQQQALRLPDGGSLSVTVSIGAAGYDGHPDPDRLVARADQALYAAKAAGRNRWHLG